MITYYKWVGQPKPHHRKFRAYYRPAGDTKSHRDFATEEDAQRWADSERRHIIVGGHPIGVEVDRYLLARTTEVEASTIETLR